MMFRIRTALQRRIFALSCRHIRDTPPVTSFEGAKVTIVTMLSHCDIIMYLIAIKSLSRCLSEACILILNDGSLTVADLALLRNHIIDSRVVPLASINTAPCPTGGCWERLMKILELSCDGYVIQMDSDTVTLSDIPEVLACVRQNRSFLLGGEDGQAVVTVEANAEFLRESASAHLQVLAEKSLPRLGPGFGRRYVRGGAAFAGFARGAFSPESAAKFSVDMQKFLGAKWRDWGSEQVASNYLIANSPDPCVLPYPKYASLWPGVPYQRASFLHCLGTNRFKGGVYRSLAKRTLRELSDVHR